LSLPKCLSHLKCSSHLKRFVQSKTRVKRAHELPEENGLIFGFQVTNVDCLPEVFPGFCWSFQG
jgi:hypothetical protein